MGVWGRLYPPHSRFRTGAEEKKEETFSLTDLVSLSFVQIRTFFWWWRWVLGMDQVLGFLGGSVLSCSLFKSIECVFWDRTLLCIPGWPVIYLAGLLSRTAPLGSHTCLFIYLFIFGGWPQTKTYCIAKNDLELILNFFFIILYIQVICLHVFAPRVCTWRGQKRVLDSLELEL